MGRGWNFPGRGVACGPAWAKGGRRLQSLPRLAATAAVESHKEGGVVGGRGLTPRWLRRPPPPPQRCAAAAALRARGGAACPAGWASGPRPGAGRRRRDAGTRHPLSRKECPLVVPLRREGGGAHANRVVVVASGGGRPRLPPFPPPSFAIASGAHTAVPPGMPSARLHGSVRGQAHPPLLAEHGTPSPSPPPSVSAPAAAALGGFRRDLRCSSPHPSALFRGRRRAVCDRPPPAPFSLSYARRNGGAGTGKSPTASSSSRRSTATWPPSAIEA